MKALRHWLASWRSINFIAWHLLRNRRMRHGAMPGGLSTAGIAVGVASLIVVLSVMNGFQMGFIEDILEIRSFHIRFAVTEEITPSVLDRVRSLPGILAVVPFRETQTLVAGGFSDYEPIVLRGTSPRNESGDEGFYEQIQIQSGSFDISDDRNVVLGIELAERLQVGVGAVVRLVSLAESTGFRPATEELIVTGLFRSGFYEIDSSLAFCSLSSVAFGDSKAAATEVGVKLARRFRDREALSAIVKILPDSNSPVSWREYNRAFFGALRIEKLTMALLLALIYVVVAFNIAQFLTRSVIEKRVDISVVKASGATPSQVRNIFLAQGALIGVVGGSSGAAIGLLIVFHIEGVLRILESIANTAITAAVSLLGGSALPAVSFFSPAHFYLTSIPIRVVPLEVAVTVAVALLSTLLSAYVASRKLASIDPQRILRYE